MFHTADDHLVYSYPTCCAITSGIQNIPFSRWGDYGLLLTSHNPINSKYSSGQHSVWGTQSTQYKAANEVSTQAMVVWELSDCALCKLLRRLVRIVWCIEEQQTRLGDARWEFVVGSMSPVPKCHRLLTCVIACHKRPLWLPYTTLKIIYSVHLVFWITQSYISSL